MADFYKLLKADKLGEPWTPSQPGAKPIQRWWCQVEGMDEAVSVGKTVGNELRPGMHIYGDLKYAKSQKGTQYWKFDSQMVPQGVTRPMDAPGTPAQAEAQEAVGGQMPSWFLPTHNMVKYIYDEMKKLEVPSANEQTKAFNDTMMGEVHEPSEEMTQETKDMLDDIFGKPDEEK